MSKKTKPRPEAEEKPEADKEEAQEIKEEEQPDPIAQLEDVIQKLENDLKNAKNDAALAYANADNMQKRLAKQAQQDKKYRFQNAALELLPILDSMNLALSHTPNDPEAKTFAKGFEMIRTQLEQVLEKEGVKEIELLGKPFDANYAQAIMTEKVDGTEPGIVTEVLQKGYMLKDRMLRPAMVKVSE